MSLIPEPLRFPSLPETRWSQQENSFDCGIFVCLFVTNYCLGNNFWNSESSEDYRAMMKRTIRNKSIDFSGLWFGCLLERDSKTFHFTLVDFTEAHPVLKGMPAAVTPSSLVPKEEKKEEGKEQQQQQQDQEREKKGKGKRKASDDAEIQCETQVAGQRSKRQRGNNNTDNSDSKAATTPPSPSKTTRGASWRGHEDIEEEERWWAGFIEKQSTFDLTTKKGKKDALEWVTTFKWAKRRKEAEKVRSF